jgi:tetratricopeptide (TPR) repeat protein
MKQNKQTVTSPSREESSAGDEISDRIIAYDEALKTALDNLHVSDKDLESHVRDTLIARDSVAQSQVDADQRQKIINSDDLKKLAELDRQLKADAKKIVSAIGRPKLKDWREAIGAQQAAWWWSLDDRVPSERSTPTIVLNYVLWIMIAIALSFILEIVRRFLNGSTDLASTVLQGLLALLATGTVVQGARQLIAQSSLKAGQSGYLTQRTLTVAVVILVGVAALMEWGRPKVAVIYNDKGVELYEQKQLTKAIEKYQRAISLDPSYAQAHFNMGNAYEDVLNYDKAISEYELAIMADQDFYRPYNNIARLYIIYRNEPLKALPLLDKALTLHIDPQDDPTAIKYRLYKNRGWANLLLKNYKQAKVDLNQALSLVANGADAHCLLAQVLDGQKDASALGEWTLCKILADQQKEEPEPNWSGLAREHLKDEDKNK